MIRTVRVEIEGRVQGVWFRNWTRVEACKRGLDGWVRNRRNGSVEAAFSGPGDDVEAMITACRTGPPQARVEDVQVFENEPPPEQPGFSSLATF